MPLIVKVDPVVTLSPHHPSSEPGRDAAAGKPWPSGVGFSAGWIGLGAVFAAVDAPASGGFMIVDLGVAGGPMPVGAAGSALSEQRRDRDQRHGRGFRGMPRSGRTRRTPFLRAGAASSRPSRYRRTGRWARPPGSTRRATSAARSSTGSMARRTSSPRSTARSATWARSRPARAPPPAGSTPPTRSSAAGRWRAGPGGPSGSTPVRGFIPRSTPWPAGCPTPGPGSTTRVGWWAPRASASASSTRSPSTGPGRSTWRPACRRRSGPTARPRPSTTTTSSPGSATSAASSTPSSAWQAARSRTSASAGPTHRAMPTPSTPSGKSSARWTGAARRGPPSPGRRHRATPGRSTSIPCSGRPTGRTGTSSTPPGSTTPTRSAASACSTACSTATS